MLESIGRSRRTYKTTVNMSSIGERVAAKHEEEEHECPQRQTFKKESEPVAAAEEEARRLLKAAGLANDRTTSKKKRKSEKIPQTPKKKRGRKKLPLDQLKGAIDAVDPKTFEIKQSGVAGKALVEHLKSDRANESAWILERGQLLWFYRKKIDAEKPHSLADVQRLYMVGEGLVTKIRHVCTVY